ncbi:hypothetical protein NDU88_002979 [Pleurodeles waltl]|uniref:Uncharacterized protein n=1 Tax=Pleurodeles waltl TaxID=8319 RepID=A0AAV7T3R6_PLEWA|nr:hypothetical protein NDU88_002979 [Pleurodeles waltl]
MRQLRCDGPAARGAAKWVQTPTVRDPVERGGQRRDLAGCKCCEAEKAKEVRTRLSAPPMGQKRLTGQTKWLTYGWGLNGATWHVRARVRGPMLGAREMALWQEPDTRLRQWEREAP